MFCSSVPKSTFLVVLLSFQSSETASSSVKKNWEEANSSCNVPSIEDLRTNTSNIEFPAIFPAWLGNVLMVSKWAYFDGCIDTKQKIADTPGLIEDQLSSMFPNDSRDVTSNIFYCAYTCTGKTTFFTYIQELCQCIGILDQYKNGNTMRCIKPCIDNDSILCLSGHGLPLFKFAKDDFEKSVERKLNSYHSRNQCLLGYVKHVTDCTESHRYSCSSDIINQVKTRTYSHYTWSNAVNKCAQENDSIPVSVKNKNDKIWLGYFSHHYDSNKGVGFEFSDDRKRCISVKSTPERNNVATYLIELRNCSDVLSFFCFKDTNLSSPTTVAVEFSFLDTVTQVFLDATNTTTASRDWFEGNIDFIIAAVVIAILIIIVITLSRIICQLKKKLKVALYTNLTVDREQYPYSDIPRFQHSIRSYMEILPMSPIVHSENDPSFAQDITQQTITEAEGFTTPRTHDELEVTEHYQLVT